MEFTNEKEIEIYVSMETEIDGKKYGKATQIRVDAEEEALAEMKDLLKTYSITKRGIKVKECAKDKTEKCAVCVYDFKHARSCENYDWSCSPIDYVPTDIEYRYKAGYKRKTSRNLYRLK